METTISPTGKPPVYRSIYHYLFSQAKDAVIRFYDKGQHKDMHGQLLRHGDRIFNLNFKYTAAKDNFGTVVKDATTFFGYAVRWDNGEYTEFVNFSRVIKLL